MFEYHGWAIVRDDSYSSDAARLHRTVEELRQVIREFGDGAGVADVRWVNGVCMVWFAGCPNHRHERVFGLFPWLAERASGSYGLLYVWDDESHDQQNEFRVWRLLRGRVEETADNFLSPCIPTIEDPYDPTRPD
jgi:hypothetical protein